MAMRLDPSRPEPTAGGPGNGDHPGASRALRAAGSAWRTRDIVVTAVIGVAFGVVFWAWGLAWGVFEPLNAVFPVLRDSLYAIWLVPAVLAPLIVRKPGAAIFAETVAAGVSALIGSQWGVDALVSGIVQGAGAELIFALVMYRSWSLPILALAAIASSVAAWIHDWVLWYPDVAVELQLARGILMAMSAVVFVAAGSRWLADALRRAGVLDAFPG
jgi:energy-coupling factor transport system substrate-specific component